MAKTCFSTLKFKVIGHNDWDGFIDDFMKAIHMI